MKPISLVSFLLLCCQLSFAQSTYKATVYFDTDSHVLTKESEDELSSHLAEPNITAIQIEGHTDNEGNTEYNRQLSQRRANAVKAYLTSSGIAGELIKISFFGEDAPITENQTASDKSLNRRVEITFYYAPIKVETPAPIVEEIPEPIIEPVATTVEYVPDSVTINNTELYAALAKQVPTYDFIINNKLDTMLKLPSGMLLYFNAYIFDLANEDCRERVRLQVAEYSNRSYAVLGNMTTISNGELLYSAGMLDINAFCNDEKAALKNGKKYKIFSRIPDEVAEQQEDFKGFYGVKDASGQQVNWEQASNRNFQVLEREIGCKVCNNGGSSFIYKEKKYSIFRRIFTPKKVQAQRRMDKRRATKAYRARKLLKDTDTRQVSNALNCGQNTNVEQGWNYFVFTPRRFGLTNLDAFWNKVESTFKKERTNILVNVVPKNNTQVYLVFKSRRSIMVSSEIRRKSYHFKKLPKSQPIWVVAVKQTDEGDFMMGMTEANTNNKQVEVKFESFDGAEPLAKALEKING